MVGDDVERDAPIAPAMAADVGQAARARPEGRLAPGVRALGGDHDHVRDEREHRHHREGRGGAQAQRARVGAAVQGHERCGRADDGEQDEHDEALRRRVAVVQRAHGSERRRSDRRGRARAEGDEDRAQLATVAIERDQGREAGQQAGDRAAREAQVGPHAQRRRGRRGRRAQRPGTVAVARDASAEHEADGGQRSGGVPVGQWLLEAPAGPRAGVQVDDAGQQAPGEPVADDHERAGGQGRLEQPRGAPVAPREGARGEGG
jgi:hypothetical protein